MQKNNQLHIFVNLFFFFLSLKHILFYNFFFFLNNFFFYQFIQLFNEVKNNWYGKWWIFLKCRTSCGGELTSCSHRHSFIQNSCSPQTSGPLVALYFCNRWLHVFSLFSFIISVSFLAQSSPFNKEFKNPLNPFNPSLILLTNQQTNLQTDMSENSSVGHKQFDITRLQALICFISPHSFFITVPSLTFPTFASILDTLRCAISPSDARTSGRLRERFWFDLWHI